MIIVKIIIIMKPDNKLHEGEFIVKMVFLCLKLYIHQREPKKPKNWDYKYLFYYSLTVNNITYHIT